MKIISLLGSKGGSGKSAIALLLSALLSQKHKVALLDCDIQSTCMSAKVLNPDLPYEVASAPHLKEIVLQGRRFEENGIEWLVIDTNPRSFLEHPRQIDELINISDLCILPCRPAPRDVRANVELAGKIASQGSTARILWNFVQPRANAHKESMRQAPKLLGLKAMKNFIKQRTCYQDVFDESPLPTKNKDGMEEISAVFKEIRRMIK